MPVLSSHPFLLVHFHSHTKKEPLMQAALLLMSQIIQLAQKNDLIDIN